MVSKKVKGTIGPRQLAIEVARARAAERAKLVAELAAAHRRADIADARTHDRLSALSAHVCALDAWGAAGRELATDAATAATMSRDRLAAALAAASSSAQHLVDLLAAAPDPVEATYASMTEQITHLHDQIAARDGAIESLKADVQTLASQLADAKMALAAAQPPAALRRQARLLADARVPLPAAVPDQLKPVYNAGWMAVKWLLSHAAVEADYLCGVDNDRLDSAAPDGLATSCEQGETS